MTLATAEFIRRFLIHILPKGFHRIRHYGLLAGGSRKTCIARAPRTPERCPAVRSRRCRCADRYPAAMSLLRRTHDCHRGVRTRAVSRADRRRRRQRTGRMRHDPAWHSDNTGRGHSARANAPVCFHHHDRARPRQPPAYAYPSPQRKNTPKRSGRNGCGAQNAHRSQLRDRLKIEIPIVRPSPPAGSFLD